MGKPRVANGQTRTARLTKSVRNEIRLFLQEIAATASNSTPSFSVDKAFKYFSRDNFGVTVLGDEVVKFQRIQRLIVPEDVRPNYISPQQVDALLNDAVLDVLMPSSKPVTVRVEKAIDTFSERIHQAPVDTQVFVPVMGIRLKGTVKVGPVRFISREQTIKVRWVAKALRRAKEDASGWDAGALVTVAASDQQAANDLAFYRVQLALDVINLYGPKLGAPREAAAYMPGVRAFHRAFFATRTPSAVLSEPGVSSSRVGPYPINLKSLQRFRGYRRLTRILAIERELGESDERLLSAVRWIGRGAASAWNEQAFLCFVVALESLILGPTRDTELGYRFRLRLALLLAKRGHRNAVVKRIGELYGVRSAIVHRGSFQVTASDRDAARTYASIALLDILRDASFAELKTNLQIEQWFEALILEKRGRKPRKKAVS